MLADHDATYDDPIRRAVQQFANDHGVTIRQGGTVIEPEFRTDWPEALHLYTEADRAERQRLIRKLYKDEDLAAPVVAKKLNLTENIVHYEVGVLGITRGKRNGLGTDRQVRKEERQVRVRQLYEVEGRTPVDIADMLGVSKSAVNQDVRALGLKRGTPRVSDRKLVAMVGRAITQQDDLAQLLLDHPDVSILRVSSEQAKEWEKSLARIARGVARIRKAVKATKGEP